MFQTAGMLFTVANPMLNIQKALDRVAASNKKEA